MALRCQVRHLLALVGPYVGLLSSNPSVKTCETQSVLSIPLVRKAYMPTIKWSQLPRRAPRTPFAASLGLPSFLSSLWRRAQGLLPYNVYPCIYSQSISVANPLTVTSFL